MSIKYSARTRALSTALAAVFMAAACTKPSAPAPAKATGFDIPAAVEAAAKREITAATLAAPIRYLASDALEGRGPATRGDTLARLYLATELESLGFTPAGTNNSWQQEFDVVGTTAQLPKVWNFKAKSGPVDLKLSDEYIAGSGVQNESAGFDDAELVFVGYGIEAPEFHWDDFRVST
jgi:hypothetical protein